MRDLEDVVPLHRQYVAIVREVARTENVILGDLAAEFAKLPEEVLRTRYFRSDGIHLTREGDQKAAGLLFQCFRDNDLLRLVLR